jgi:peptidoglycan hydrolase CwlO-like protein
MKRIVILSIIVLGCFAMWFTSYAKSQTTTLFSESEKRVSKLEERISNLEKKVSLLERENKKIKEESSNLREILLNFLSTSIAFGDRKIKSSKKDLKDWWKKSPYGLQFFEDLEKEIEKKGR